MDLRAELLRPQAYGPPAPASVDVIETHVSWVFLAGEEVFKVKKPVALGFLDFRSTERRRAACEAEVRLNARLAPHVYRGVVAIRRGDDGRLCVGGGSGPAVDWAVRMVRLSDEDRADERLARGALSVADVHGIAERLAAFHRDASTDPETAARYASAEAVTHNVEENFAQIGDGAERYLSRPQADELVSWQSAFVRKHAALFTKRIAAGCVRDGHGDLRLEHVYLSPSAPPTIIDCIEFDDRFRIGDVCADVAFLSMDLAGHDRVDLAELLLARYARAANDYDLYELVDFYESYRAYVRAKIANLVAADGHLPLEARRRAGRDARRLLLLALSADRRPVLRPQLVAVGGLIASGKSTLAERLGVELAAPVVASDRTRKAMLGVGATRRVSETPWHGAYGPELTERVYAEVLRRAEVVLASGRPAIIDASFRTAAMRRAARELAGRLGVAFRFVECRADTGVIRERLAARADGSDHVSDARLDVLEEFRSRYEPVDELPVDVRVRVDTTRPLEEVIRSLHPYVGAWSGGPPS